MLVEPNKAAAPNDFALQITKDGQPVTGADVTVTFAMLDMEMGNQEYQLTETAPGVYSRTAPALVMVGHWGLSFTRHPEGRRSRSPPSSSTTPPDDRRARHSGSSRPRSASPPARSRP